MKVSLKVKNSTGYNEVPQSFNGVITSYHTDFSNIREFFENSPQDIAAHFSGRMPSSENLKKLGNTLCEYNKKLGADEKTLENIKLLQNAKARVVVSGQQPTVLTGALLVLYKALSAVKMAENLEKTMMSPVVPIFWNASEDHNMAELDHTFFLNGDGSLCNVKFPFDNDKNAGMSLGSLPIHTKLADEAFLKQVQGSLFETEFTPAVMELIRDSYNQSKTYADWFGRLILHFFKGTGLIILDPALPGIKKLAVPILKKAIEDPVRPSQLVNEVGGELYSLGYKKQIVRKDDQCSFFLYNKQGQREKVSYSDGVYTTASRAYTKDELLSVLETECERFSPNVILRPILSEYLLPSISYMAGPGELSYYAQLKSVYKLFDVPMPIIQSRLSMSILESKIVKVLDKFSFSPTDFLGDTSALVTEYVRSKNKLASEQFWGDISGNIRKTLDDLKSVISEDDPASFAPVEQMTQKMLWQLGKIEEKVVKNQKTREKELALSMEKVKKNVKPDNKLQERQLNIFYYINKYGFSFWEAIMRDAPTDYTCHHFVSIKTNG